MSCSIKRLFKINKDVLEVLLMLEVSHSILRFKICSVVLRPGLKPACCSAMIVTAWCFSLFNRTFSMALLGWPIRLIVR